ncbi:hypothetical protein L596_011973 [Steinernema carpocapsae]|uniref:Uncharacterized protein n=1 Tax=Steinernema carpocapsae TaxID=34508 RepID=A0A4U5NWB9_STECR|nr:hypothetical protein L596_011973 [Steinernema carpocapsae]
MAARLAHVIWSFPVVLESFPTAKLLSISKTSPAEDLFVVRENTRFGVRSHTPEHTSSCDRIAAIFVVENFE